MHIFMRIVIGVTIAMLMVVPAPQADARDRSEAGQRQSLMHGSVERSYVVRMPGEGVLRRGKVPLVLMLHGGGGNAANAERMSGFTAKGRREGFIVVYPEGSSRGMDKLLTWNAGHCCGYAMKNQADDVGFISALIDKLASQYPIDRNRVYVTGMSNGGMMSHRLGRELSGKIAAIAPVVATIFGDEQRPAHAVSAIMINGQLDTSVPHEGGPPGGRAARAWDGTPAKPALHQGAFWSGVNGCATTPKKSDRGASLHWKYECPAGTAVELYLVKDSGHSWPGGEAGSRRGDQPSQSMNATDVIWDFFKTQSR